LAVLGASGYAGQELIRLALAHPRLEIEWLGSREHAGASADEALPGVDPRVASLPPFRDPLDLVPALESGAVDAVMACLPHGAWRALAREHPLLAERSNLVIDLSADYRNGEAGYLYGLPEAFRAALPSATRIANPGCYPTAFALALLPAAENGWLDGPVAVSALSGASGAGRAPQLRTSLVERSSSASIYRAGGDHPHVAEMERVLSRLGTPLPVGFVPQLAPMSRGILLTAMAPLSQAIEPEEARAAYRRRFAEEPFVRVLAEDVWPDTRDVRHSNRCDVAVTTLHGGRTLLATAALDNLIKGAAGQAIQNLNLARGWPETTGLPAHGVPW
jgi:N-acetyl-gamma-glutamyl-phosphate reductase